MNTPQALAKSSDDLAQLVAPVLVEDLYWFPVRHHSPAAAHFVSEAIIKRKPRCVLLEASTHLQHLLPYLLKKTKPPVALYSSARIDVEVSSTNASVSWYPLLEYSPEWQAIQAATKVGAEIIFIDLPHYCQPADEQGLPDNSASFYQSLSDRAGYLNWHECWDTLFEQTLHQRSASYDYDNFREQLMYFAAAARYQTDGDESPALLARECYMWGNIKQALQRYPATDTMVVCGALHLFMERDDSGFADLQAEVTKAEKELTLNTTIVPYSYRRIAMQHGYAAGNRAPWFYYQLWRNRKKPERTQLEHIHNILSTARKLGQPISAADTLSVAHHAKLLSQLRNREHPVLDDIEDAVWACCCKGDPAAQGSRLSKAIKQANIGKRIGTINPDLGQLPLVNEFYAQLHLLDIELPALDERRTLQCDLRTPEGLARSQFLHRLNFLKLPCATQIIGSQVSQAKLFSESWALTALGSDEALIEYSEYGDTIETVAQTKIIDLIKKQLLEIDKLISTLENSQVMGFGVFHGAIPEQFRNGLQQNGDFNTLARVFQGLLKIWQQQKYLDAVEPPAEPLLALCFLRSSLSLGKMVDIPTEEQALFVSGLRVLAEAWLSMNDLAVDREIFEQELINASSNARSPFVHGCCYGLLLESGRRTMEDFTVQLNTYTTYGTGDSLLSAAIWIEGVMSTTKVTMLSGAVKFSQAIDSLLKQASQEQFLLMLPRLRSGFDAIPRVQRDALAISVAKMYGMNSTENLKRLATDHGDEAIQDLSTLDQQVQTIMERWGLNT